MDHYCHAVPSINKWAVWGMGDDQYLVNKGARTAVVHALVEVPQRLAGLILLLLIKAKRVDAYRLPSFSGQSISTPQIHLLKNARTPISEDLSTQQASGEEAST